MKKLMLFFSLLYSGQIAYSQAVDFKPDLYIIAVGVSEYTNYPSKHLEYAVNDAENIIKKFRASDMYNKVHPFLLTDSNATRGKIIPLRKVLMNSTVDDQVIIFFSGHGTIDTASLEFYFCTGNFDAAKPASTGITFNEMEYLLDSIPSRKKIFLIDACHSGELDKEAIKGKSAIANKIPDNGKPFAPLSFKTSQYTFDMMKELFVDVRKFTGSTILASSGGLDYSYEERKWGQGIFTYAILTSLTKGITIAQLVRILPESVRKLSSYKQSPVIREENIEFDYRIW